MSNKHARFGEAWDKRRSEVYFAQYVARVRSRAHQEGMFKIKYAHLTRQPSGAVDLDIHLIGIKKGASRWPRWTNGPRPRRARTAAML